MNKKYCYWSISWGDYDYIAQTMVNSARQVGVEEDFIIFSEKQLNNCTNLRLNPNIHLDQLQFFKFEYLKEELSKFDYEYFIFIDADHFFVRKPLIPIDEIMRGSPWHSFLESPINSYETQRRDWWGIPNGLLENFMRRFGVLSHEIRNSNGGFWICHKDFIKDAHNLAYKFHHEFAIIEKKPPEEVSIAYLSHLMSPKIEDRFVERFFDYWGADWTENFKDTLPENRPWEYTSYMTYKKYKINPAIVHAMRSKNALIEKSKILLS